MRDDQQECSETLHTAFELTRGLLISPSHAAGAAGAAAAERSKTSCERCTCTAPAPARAPTSGSICRQLKVEDALPARHASVSSGPNCRRPFAIILSPGLRGRRASESEARAIHKQEIGHLRGFSVYKTVAEGRILGQKKARVQSVFYSTPYERILSILRLFFTSGETPLTQTPPAFTKQSLELLLSKLTFAYNRVLAAISHSNLQHAPDQRSGHVAQHPAAVRLLSPSFSHLLHFGTMYSRT